MSTAGFTGMTLEELALEASRLRQALIVAERENEKIPALQREHERLKGKLDRAVEKADTDRSVLNARSVQIAALESQLRAKERVGADLVSAQDKAREAIEMRDVALADRRDTEDHNSELMHDLDAALRELEYRKKHTEALRQLSQAIETAKEVT